mmetsp:Transcript_6503/g.17973  ORF Transcript_6503/g.17973 Transcript_6503/m.17973 type:complete len:231 (+) Transcript_6503:1918-2610(+)
MCALNWDFCRADLSPPSPSRPAAVGSSTSSPASFLMTSCALMPSSTSLSVSPVIVPIFDPAISQNLARLLLSSFFSRISFTSLLPFLEMTAMSDVGSLSGTTGPFCFERTLFPLKKGGRASCTTSITLESSKSASRSTSSGLTTPLVSNLFSSHAFMSRCISDARLLWASVIRLPSLLVNRFCAISLRRISDGSCSASPRNGSWLSSTAPVSSCPYQSLSICSSIRASSS